MAVLLCWVSFMLSVTNNPFRMKVVMLSVLAQKLLYKTEYIFKQKLLKALRKMTKLTKGRQLREFRSEEPKPNSSLNIWLVSFHKTSSRNLKIIMLFYHYIWYLWKDFVIRSSETFRNTMRVCKRRTWSFMFVKSSLKFSNKFPTCLEEGYEKFLRQEKFLKVSKTFSKAPKSS